MLADFYQKNFLKNPRFVLSILIILLLNFLYFTKDFKLDASSDTLLLENDPDLKYLRKVTDTYGSNDFLVITYSPSSKIISNQSINELLNLKQDIQKLNWVKNVITILDIPLLENSDEPISEKLKNFKTLKDKEINREKGFYEILNSPVFRIVSKNK